MEGNWRFAGNNYTNENGLDTADMETFKKDPIASLARETCQNAIDAREKGKTKAVIEFKSFKIKSEEIPGYMRLRAEIENCKEYKKGNKDYDQLCNMAKEIAKDELMCLRVSDFNTTGLVGDKFYLLTKGSGITDKGGTSGGSKGIGKFASFVASEINTVFYSTYTNNGDRKSIGISRLCSAPMPDTDEKTMGTGYYGINEKNEPLFEEICLDKSYIRDTYGTDIFVLGFREEKNWKYQILAKLLDSFLIAIYNDELEIRIDNIIVNKDNLFEIINDDNIPLEGNKRSIKAQYTLINKDEGVFYKECDVLGYGNIKLYVKSYSKEEADNATNNCIAIRYPYMKIKTLPSSSVLPCSVMCIIENNDLNKLLRDIENPQHTDWEPKRKKEEEQSEIKNILQTIKKSITDFVFEVLSSSETEKLDIEGAGDYLPDVSIGNEGLGGAITENSEIKDKPTIIKKRTNKTPAKNASVENTEDDSLQPDMGGHDGEGDESPVPNGNNNGKGGQPHDSGNTGKTTPDGDNDIMKRVPITAIKKTFFVENKLQGKYVLIIDMNYFEEDCELEIYYFDDSNTIYKAQIEECMVGSEDAKIENGKAVGFKIRPGKLKIKVKTNLKEYYRFEVRLYANRK